VALAADRPRTDNKFHATGLRRQNQETIGVEHLPSDQGESSFVMSQESQFRSVLRGYDPEQVRSAMDELQSSIVTARRIAADRTIELTRAEEQLSRANRELDEAAARIVELERRPAQGSGGGGDVGTRIGSILALANEEAEELRAAGREDARRQLDEAEATIAASRAEAERYVDEIRRNADDQANRMLEEARRQAAELRAEAERDAQGRRAEAQAFVDRHRAQADAVAAFGAQIAEHAERLRLAQARVEQLAYEEASLVESQAKENADRIEQERKNQLAAVDARRESITAQLGTVDSLMRELGDAVGAPLGGVQSEPATADRGRQSPGSRDGSTPVMDLNERTLDNGHHRSDDGRGTADRSSEDGDEWAADDEGVEDVDAAQHRQKPARSVS
jgi:cell division septum initiation protein DivIVA